MSEVLNVEEIFGQNVFTLGKMKERLPKSVYKEVKTVMDKGGELSLAAADVVAKAMKDWAVENGALIIPIGFNRLPVLLQKNMTLLYPIPMRAAR